MVLTWATVSATFIDLGNLNIVIALGIAVIKASLVVLYFMHLRYDNPFNAFVFIASVLFVMLFIGFALIDRKEYAPELIPNYAPAMDQANAPAGGAAAPAGAPAGSAPATGATPPGAAGQGAAADTAHGAAQQPAAAGADTSAAHAAPSHSTPAGR
jgi:cytochrome c oxidase subunit 4